MESKEKTHEQPKAKIIPSYMKKEENQKKGKAQKNKGLHLKSKITLVIIPILLVLIIGGIATGIYFLIDSQKYKEFEQYENKMNIYGFSKMYNNGTSKTNESVTQSEAIKLIVSTVLNVYDISDFAPLENAQYENEIWVKYAEYIGIIPENTITGENENKKIKYIDAITYLFEAKRKLLDKEADLNEAIQIKDYEKYTDTQKLALQDMTWNKVIPDERKNINGKANIFKGQLNRLLLNFAENYNTITLDDQKINISEEKIPFNVYEYPYTLASINKEVYEKRFFFSDEINSILPIDLYAEYKTYYKEYVYKTQTYLNTILNIDYQTVDENILRATLNAVTLLEIDPAVMTEYVNYIKANKIKITGQATVQLPAIYHDGLNLRVRTKLTFKVESADNLNNLLLFDLTTGENYLYQLGENTLYVDLPLSQYEDSYSYYVSLGSVMKSITGQIKKF